MGKALDLTNQKFGKWTALYKISVPRGDGKTRTYWHCICECGTERDVVTDSLRNGKSKSCGCEKIIPKNKSNLIGKRFGKLTVINETEQRDVKGNIIWECKCDCGNISYVSTNSLNSKNTTSCGKCHNSLGEEAIKNILISHNIIFTQQQKFESCRFIDTNYPAKFDFYVNNEYLIEYDGQQHFIFTDKDWNTKTKFNKTKEHDEYKNKWCKDNNIPLIRIPYTHLNNICIEDLLLETSQWRIV